MTDYHCSFAIVDGLNLGFVIIETFYGIAADSLALLADAVTISVMSLPAAGMGVIVWKVISRLTNPKPVPDWI